MNTSRFAIIASISLAFACNANAVTIWTGAISTDISNAGNWNNGLPTNSSV